MRKLLCRISLHSYEYLPNPHGGRPMRRVCKCCGKFQVWDWLKARCKGIIVWVDADAA